VACEQRLHHGASLQQIAGCELFRPIEVDPESCGFGRERAGYQRERSIDADPLVWAKPASPQTRAATTAAICQRA
jgi:hypothetical protein